MPSASDKLPLDGARRVFERCPPLPAEGLVELACRRLCELAIIAMMVIVTSEVVVRSFFGMSLQSVDELGGYLLVGVSFLSLSTCFVRGAFHKVELFDARLGELGHAIRKLILDIISLAFCLILFWQLVRLALRSWESGDLASTILSTPLWIPQLTMPIGTGALCYSLFKAIWVDMRWLGALSQTEI